MIGGMKTTIDIPEDILQEVMELTKAKTKREAILTASPTDWMEWQAGYASGAFLMPISAVRDLVGELRSETSDLAPIALGTGVAEELIGRVQGAFSVSAEAARVRLLKCGYIVEASPNASLFSAPQSAE